MMMDVSRCSGMMSLLRLDDDPVLDVSDVLDLDPYHVARHEEAGRVHRHLPFLAASPTRRSQAAIWRCALLVSPAVNSRSQRWRASSSCSWRGRGSAGTSLAF